jgi:hypothetical protein
MSGVWGGSLKKDATCKKYAWMGGECQSHVIEDGWYGMDWINVVEGRDKWQVFVNMLMNPCE